jgi:hypothetical protein
MQLITDAVFFNRKMLTLPKVPELGYTGQALFR